MAPKLHRKRCKFCNKPYSTYEEDKDYCEDYCQLRDSTRLKIPSREERGIRLLTPEQIKNQWKMRNRQCYHCGDIYKVPKKIKVVRNFTEGDYNPYWYCSEECQGSKVSRQMAGAVTNKCKVCGERFLGAAATTCSEECRHTHRKQQQEKDTIKRRKQALEKPPEEKKKRRRISYEELNRRAEVQRLNEEWSRLTR